MNSKYNILKKTQAWMQLNQTVKSQVLHSESFTEKKLITYKEFPIELTANFSSETTEFWTQGDGIFKALYAKNCQPRILYQQNYTPETKEKYDIGIFKKKQYIENLVLANLPY